MQEHTMKKRILVSFLIATILVPLLGSSFVASASPDDASRIERLAGLGKLWGAVKYFHPYLADRDVDWDAALVKTIPKVEAANSAEEYRQAMDFMLSFLHDPNTHVVNDPSSSATLPAPPPGPPQPYVKWVDDQTALIVANDYAHFQGSFAKAADFAKVFTEAAKAKTIILDVRTGQKSTDENFIYWYANAFRQNFPALLNRNVIAASQRSRAHSGYATQIGGDNSYYSAFVTQDGETIHGRAPKDQSHRFVFIVNAGSRGFHDILGGLQSAGVATVIQEGEAGEEGGAASFQYSLPENTNVVMRTGETVNPDGSIGFHPDVIVPESSDFSGDRNPAIVAALRAAKQTPATSASRSHQAAPLAVNKLENRYPDMKYPSLEYRLLSLFRFWNVMFYFHAYRQLYDRSWEETLTDFIPQFEADRNELEYAITTAKLVARIQDSHGFMQSSVLEDYIGNGDPPIGARWIEGQTVITEISDDTVRATGLAVGDVILAVDGEDIEARRNRLGELFAASTPQALRLRVSGAVLSGPEDKPALLKIKNAHGEIKEASVMRNSTAQPPKDDKPTFRVLPEGFGYIDLTRLQPAEVDQAFETIKNTPGLIFDMRGYPNGVAGILGARFADRRVPVAVFETPTPQTPDPSEWSRVRHFQYAEPDSNWKYKGKVVVLINEQAISQSEHTCLFLEVTAHAKFIGSPTQGANGDGTQTVLPGGIVVFFSGNDVRHADGRQLQRVGIQPDVRVEPTIQGIREGLDEVLERAISYLKDHISLPITSSGASRVMLVWSEKLPASRNGSD
jgi:C-terminal processing protease CtpA/Prc